MYRLPAEAVLREEAAENGLGGTRPGLSEKRHYFSRHVEPEQHSNKHQRWRAFLGLAPLLRGLPRWRELFKHIRSTWKVLDFLFSILFWFSLNKLTKQNVPLKQ